MWKYLMFFGLGYSLGKLRPAAADAPPWLDDVLLRGFAADQVAQVAGPAPVLKLAQEFASTLSVPPTWTVQAAASGVPVARLRTFAAAVIAIATSHGPPQDGSPAGLAAWKNAVCTEAIAQARE